LSSPGAVLRVLRGEGVRSAWRRALDHAAAARNRRAYRPVPLAELPPVPVLEVTATAPLPWLGGVPAQLAARRAAGGDDRRALLYPWQGHLRLEVDAGGKRLVARLPAAGEPGAAVLVAVPGVLAALGARLLHVEGAAGLAPDALAALAESYPTVLALHDFALLCPRPHLYDPQRGESCGGCADAAECDRRNPAVAGASASAVMAAAERRSAARVLVVAATCCVFPSRFLRDEHHRLLGPLETGGGRVLAPGIAGDGDGDAAPSFSWRGSAARPRLPRVAFLGGGAPHKGAALFAGLAGEWARRGLPRVAWQVFGGGAPAEMRALRRLGDVRVHGYYRFGTLPKVLAHGADLALVLSLVPETYSLAVSESLAAGVPVLALDRGALGERLASGGGLLVPPPSGIGGLVDGILAWMRGATIPPPATPPATAAHTAAAWQSLHAELLAASTSSPTATDPGYRSSSSPAVRRGVF
jgi:glycosyltransferase involved in cell wall biosynthesis